MAAAFVMPARWGVTGLGVYRFGDELYNEQMLTAGFSNQLGLTSLGLRVNYLQYHAEGFGTKGVMTVSFGGLIHFTKNFSVGAHIVNINQPKLASSDRSTNVPTIMSTGMAYQPFEKLLVTSEVEKQLTYPVRWKAGIEYAVHDKALIRTGFAIRPSVASVGLGFKPRKFVLDYAYQYNFSIGASHQATVEYKFKAK